MQDIKPKNPLLRIKYHYLEWRWDRVLEKSRYRTWENYFRNTDPDFAPWGRTVQDQLHGYPYIALVPFKNLETTFNPLIGLINHGNHIREWCDKNCSKKYRWHWERVVMDHAGQYVPNGVGGYDELFFGFKERRDYTLFVLKWC